MKLRHAGLALTLLGLTFASFAYDGWSGISTVKSVRNYDTGQVLVQMTSAANPGSCGDTNYILLPQDGSDARKKQYTVLLSAYMTGETVNLALTGCSAGGSGYPIIEQVWLIKP